MDGRVQGLDASAKHLRGLGDGGDILDGEATLPDHLGGTAGGQNPDMRISGMLFS